jgi:hypothetical protein
MLHCWICQASKGQFLGKIRPVSQIAMEDDLLIRRSLTEKGLEVMGCRREFNCSNQQSIRDRTVFNQMIVILPAFLYSSRNGR